MLTNFNKDVATCLFTTAIEPGDGTAAEAEQWFKQDVGDVAQS
jgi:hypothetical protein